MKLITGGLSTLYYQLQWNTKPDFSVSDKSLDDLSRDRGDADYLNTRCGDHRGGLDDPRGTGTHQGRRWRHLKRAERLDFNRKQETEKDTDAFKETWSITGQARNIPSLQWRSSARARAPVPPEVWHVDSIPSEHDGQEKEEYMRQSRGTHEGITRDCWLIMGLQCAWLQPCSTTKRHSWHHMDNVKEMKARHAAP